MHKKATRPDPADIVLRACLTVEQGMSAKLVRSIRLARREVARAKRIVYHLEVLDGLSGTTRPPVHG